MSRKWEVKSLRARLKLLNTYIDSWTAEGQVIEGITVTYWDQQMQPIEHVMHYYPLIMALLVQSDDRREFAAARVTRAKEMGYRLLSLQDSSGMFSNAWGDVPPKNTGPILQAAPALALIRLYQASGEELFLGGANRALDSILRIWGVDHGLRNNVVNQTAVFLNLMCEMYRVNPKSELLDRIVKSTKWILSNQHEGGGFPQGDHDCRRFLVYNAKIAHGLLAADELLGWEIIGEALTSLLEFLIFYQIPSGTGRSLFISHTDLQLLPNRAYLNLYRFMKFVPTGRRRLVAASHTLAHRELFHPVWIARSSSILYSILAIDRKIALSDARLALAEGVSALMSQQYSIGGFPNSIGFNSSQTKSWADVACPMRWNAYCYLLLSELTAADYRIELPALAAQKSVSIPFNEGSDRRIWHENAQSVEIRGGDGKLITQFSKTQRR